MLDNTQISAVERHLKEKGSITSMEAFALYGATRLSAIIFILRDRYRGTGDNIVTIMMDGTNRFGNKMRYGKYVLRRSEA